MQVDEYFSARTLQDVKVLLGVARSRVVLLRKPLPELRGLSTVIIYTTLDNVANEQEEVWQ